ncbi:hypothetical protein LCGC14_2688350 [marine sediment metagenome]|uniref:Uncharacterized protein n=1 Tax=marine sediment metagenome TaxID=412755 RepID=A0A0F8ZJB6_9ZZZZ
MKRTWTQVGIEHTQDRQEEIAGMIDRLDWQTIPCTMAMMPGEGIKAVIKELRIPNVSHVACSREMAPYGLMGIKARYKNGHATIYLVDEGCSTVVIASDFFGS